MYRLPGGMFVSFLLIVQMMALEALIESTPEPAVTLKESRSTADSEVMRKLMRREVKRKRASSSSSIELAGSQHKAATSSAHRIITAGGNSQQSPQQPGPGPAFLYSSPYVLLTVSAGFTIVLGVMMMAVIAGMQSKTHHEGGGGDGGKGTGKGGFDEVLDAEPTGGGKGGKPVGGKPMGNQGDKGQSQGKGNQRVSAKVPAAKEAPPAPKPEPVKPKPEPVKPKVEEPKPEPEKPKVEEPKVQAPPPQSANAPVPQDVEPRTLEESKLVSLQFEVKKGANMPNVNTLGGVDPYVEIRSNTGEWVDVPKAKKLLMDKSKTHDSAKTKAKTGDFNPVWDQKITLKKAHYSAFDRWITIVLWDENSTGDTPIGWHQIKVVDLIGQQQYDPTGGNVPVVDYHVPHFESLLMGANKELRCTVDLAFSFWEVHEFTITIKSAAHLPKVDTIGSIDSFIELRVVEGDPRNMKYEKGKSGAAIKWSGTSKTHKDNQDPNFNQAISCVVAANPAWNLMLVLNDENITGNTPLGMVVVPWKQICCNKMGVVQTFQSTFQKLPNFDAPKNLELASLDWSIKHELKSCD